MTIGVDHRTKTERQDSEELGRHGMALLPVQRSLQCVSTGGLSPYPALRPMAVNLVGFGNFSTYGTIVVTQRV